MRLNNNSISISTSIFFLIFLVNLAESTKINLVLRPTCKLSKDWNFQATLWESDTFFDDKIIASPTYHLRDGDRSFNQIQSSESDDGLFDNWFEFYTEIVHNCTNNGKNLKLHQNLKPVAVKTSDFTIIIDYDLSNRGKN
ncbi:unnamed protein product [Caenorhabditis angaria]|uniref:Uncharacterized protein n=1 Tax=Caenorhabditis angaria TaxID=860376 RepID=A0A9P1IIJ0_9PELO|nr:unnamed protein product [Caenorhabditis angaria]